MGRPVKNGKDFSGFLPRLLILKKAIEKSDRSDRAKKSLIDLVLALVESINKDAQIQNQISASDPEGPK